MYSVVRVGKDERVDLTQGEHPLRMDDTIDVAKKKIMGILGIRVAYEELYLFTKEGPLGQLAHEGLPTNPFEATTLNVGITGTRNNTLLMDTTYFGSKEIFVSLAEDVLEAVSTDTDIESLLRAYFPLLEVESIEQLRAKREELIQETEKELPLFQKNVEMVTLFFEHGKGEIEAGVKEVEFVIHPDEAEESDMPLDTIFKLIHATEINPLTKYNPGRRSENVYRLHTNGVTATRKKVPSMPKASIFKYDNGMGREKSVSVVVKNEEANITCAFHSDWSVEVSIQFEAIKTVDVIDAFVRGTVQPVIDIVGEYLARSGKSYLRFETLRSEAVEILNMTYGAVMSNTQIGKCVSTVFNVLDASKGTMRFKRVSGYNEMSAENSLMTDMVNRGAAQSEIVAALQSNFGMDEKTAIDRYDAFLKSQQVFRDTYRSNHVKSRENPGFFTEIREYKGSSIVTITDVDHIGYLETIPMYLLALGKIPDDKCTQVEDVKPKQDVTAPDEVPDGEIQAQNYDFEADDDILGMLSDSDEEEEESDDEEHTTVARGKNKTMAMRDEEREANGWHKIKKKDDPFKKWNVERAPEIFDVKKYGFFADQSKVPIALTDEEIKYIDTHHRGSFYDTEEDRRNVFKYNEKWYICPHYWSFDEKSSVTDEWVRKNGKKIYNKKNNDDGWMPKDGVYDFRWEINGKFPIHGPPPGYNQTYPGFKLESTGNAKKGNKTQPNKRPILNEHGHPIIGCYPKDTLYKDTHGARQHQKAMRDLQVVRLGEEDKAVEPFEEKEEAVVEFQNDYVQAMDKFPLQSKRFAYLPLAVQRFLQTDNYKCQVSKSNPVMKTEHPCLLRQGTAEQTFMGALADATNMTVETLLDHLLKVLTIDVFQTLHNGNLIQLFDTSDEREVNLTPYHESKLYKSVDPSNPEQMRTLRKVVRAFESYQVFLQREGNEPTYIWDLVTMPGGLPKASTGLNLFVLELTDDDMSDKIHLVCPPNQYITAPVSFERDTLIFLKRGEIYEPVYAVWKSKEGDHYKKYFNVNEDKHLYPQFPKVLKRMSQIIETKCRPLPSEPNRHVYKRNISLYEVIQELKSNERTVTHQVLNYQGKVFGVIEKKGGFVPCYPSAPVVDVPHMWMDGVQGKSYADVKGFLEELANSTQIVCAPHLQIVEGEQVVGILTKANQFVPVVRSPAVEDGLDKFEDANHMEVDGTDPASRDEERENQVNHLVSEEKLFALFRNRVRRLMRERKHREQVEALLAQSDRTYEERIEPLFEVIRKVVGHSNVSFVEDNEGVIARLASEDLHACANQGDCALLFAKTNLINGGDNSEMYYGRIADELLRFSDLRNYIMDSNAYLQLEMVDYDFHDNEILLLQSMLTQEYFADMVPVRVNPWVKHGAYDTSTPMTGQTYTLELGTSAEEKECETSTREYTKKQFEDVSQEWMFANTPATCSFHLLLHLYNEHVKPSTPITLSELKPMLIQIYERPENASIIEEVFQKQKKGFKKTKEVSHIIWNEGYQATWVDAMALASEHSIPIVFASSRNGQDPFRTRTDENAYYIVLLKGAQQNPIFSLLTKEDGDHKFELSGRLLGIEEKDFTTYLLDFKPQSKLKLRGTYIVNSE